MMDLQIIEHHHRPAKALRFQLAEKAHKLLAVVAATEDFVVNEPPQFADGPNNGD